MTAGFGLHGRSPFGIGERARDFAGVRRSRCDECRVERRRHEGDVGAFEDDGPVGRQPEGATAEDEAAYCKESLPDPPCTGPASATNPVMMGARSRHDGGVNVCLGDGSCRFVANAVTLDAWRALSTGRGGEVNSAP